MYLKASFPIVHIDTWKRRILEWSRSFDICCHLDSNHSCIDGKYELLVGIEACESLNLTSKNQLNNVLDTFANALETSAYWWFGYLGYDLKNEIELLQSTQLDTTHFPDLSFFAAKTVIYIQKDALFIESIDRDPKDLFNQLSHFESSTESPRVSNKIPTVRHRVPEKSYLETIDTIKQHIVAGDIYEMNYCMEYYVGNIKIDPFDYFIRLNTVSKTPFAGFYHHDHINILCGSPERFLSKNGNQLISQPIKGTRKRTHDSEQDELVKNELLTSEKDRAEHVMIVDLVRNDLNKIAKVGSVKVDELFGIYSFEYVHQMISTISAIKKPGVTWVDIIKATFPMGSMTGAPKVMSMKLIEQYENTKRGAYSGALGYIDPSGDFDFNVIIRSILYNDQTNYLSFNVGGAIVFDSDPISEFDECLVKSASMLKTLI